MASEMTSKVVIFKDLYLLTNLYNFFFSTGLCETHQSANQTGNNFCDGA